MVFDLHRFAAPLVRLPWQFDAGRLQREVSRLSDEPWSEHPQRLRGVRTLALISAGGGANQDVAISGPLRETSALARSPYLRQVIGAFGVPVSRTRLLSIEPGCGLPRRCDSGYYWYRRIPVHVPVVAGDAVVLECDGSQACMHPGESWCFDNRRIHSLTNGAQFCSFHLLIDTKGSGELRRHIEAPRTAATRECSDDLSIEPYAFEVLTPDEFTDLVGIIRQSREIDALDTAAPDWRTIFARAGCSADAEAEYYLVIDRLKRAVAGVELSEDARQALHIIETVLQTDEGRPRRAGRRTTSPVKPRRLEPEAAWSPEAKHRVPDGQETLPASSRSTAIIEAFQEPRTVIEAHQAMSHGAGMKLAQFGDAARSLHSLGLIEEDLSATVMQQPVFIVSAPRAGSTMLFDALRSSDDLWTIGHESHELLERATGLHPADQGWSSNRLTPADCSPRIKSLLTHRYAREFRDRNGVSLTSLRATERPAAFRLLDKTPKNALRIPFLKSLFPDARFVYLHRAPAPNVSSMIEGWRCGRFVTYPDLPDWPYWPWSFLLPPKWQGLRGSPPAAIAAYQWASANSYILNDLAALPPESWIAVSYENLVRDPRPVLQALFRFIGCGWGAAAEEYTARPLPLSRTTLATPHADKWLKHEHVIRPLLAELTPIHTRARELECTPQS